MVMIFRLKQSSLIFFLFSPNLKKMCDFCRLLCVNPGKKYERCEKTTRKICMRVVDIYDGDTFTVVLVDSDEKIRRRRCRLMGIDTPEMKKDTKESAIRAKNRLAELLPRMPFYCSTHGFDKYGRLLVEPRFDRTSLIADVMIREGFGYKYDGGTKQNVTTEGKHL
jgi:endonuclease YncB( thermonuclease family)